MTPEEYAKEYNVDFGDIEFKIPGDTSLSSAWFRPLAGFLAFLIPYLLYLSEFKFSTLILNLSDQIIQMKLFAVFLFLFAIPAMPLLLEKKIYENDNNSIKKLLGFLSVFYFPFAFIISLTVLLI